MGLIMDWRLLDESEVDAWEGNCQQYEPQCQLVSYTFNFL